MDSKVMYKISDEALFKIQNDVEMIKVALLGNEYNPSGALYIIKAHDKCITDLDKKFNRIYWSVIGVGTGAGFIVSIIWKLVTIVM